MNKLKKILGVALIAIMIMVPVFAAQATQSVLTINTKVLGVLELGIFSSEQTGVSTFGGSGVTATVTIPNIDQELEGPSTSATRYLAVRTNQRVKTRVGIIASALKNVENTGEYMAYNITFASPTVGAATSKTIPAQATDTTVENVVTIDAATGLRVLNFPFDINITKAQYNAATIGNYTGTVTFTVTAS